jgi:hypothetical protein
MTAVAVTLLVLVATLLFVSAGAKALSPRVAAAALVELGLFPKLALAAVQVAIAIEATTSVLIVLKPGAVLTDALALSLFGVFAVTGLVVLSTGRSIECGCMGRLHSSRLGWLQLEEFTIVAITITIVTVYPPGWDSATAAAVLFAVIVATATAFLAFATPLWWQVRRARTSLAGVSEYVHHLGWPQSFVGEEPGR